MSAISRLPFAAALIAAVALFTSAISAISPEAAEVELQLARLLFNDGRFVEAFNAFEEAKTAEDSRVHRAGLTGSIKSALRLGDFTHAYADAQLLSKSAPRDPESIAVYGDALWAAGLFEQSEQKFQDALAIKRDNARALHGLARSLTGRNRLTEALETGQAAMTLDPRDAEFHHTVGSIYERMRRYEEAANAYSSYINLLPNKDRSAKAAWARAEVRFLRAFGNRPPLQIDPNSAGKLHDTLPRHQREDHRQGQGEPRSADGLRARHGVGADGHFARDRGADGHPAHHEHPERRRRRSRVRELELTRLDDLEVGSLAGAQRALDYQEPAAARCRAREMESFSPLSGCRWSSTTTAKAPHGLAASEQLSNVELPLRMHRLAMVPGQVEGGPASFILDTGGQVISIDRHRGGIERGEVPQLR
jgi:Flp pilus assembly protein TadD